MTSAAELRRLAAKGTSLHELMLLEMEGGLFVHAHIFTVKKRLSVLRDLYTVKDGKIYEVRDEGLSPYPTNKREVSSLYSGSVRIGRYDPTKKYKRKEPVELDLTQLNRLLRRAENESKRASL